MVESQPKVQFLSHWEVKLQEQAQTFQLSCQNTLVQDCYLLEYSAIGQASNQQQTKESVYTVTVVLSDKPLICAGPIKFGKADTSQHQKLGQGVAGNVVSQ